MWQCVVGSHALRAAGMRHNRAPSVDLARMRYPALDLLRGIAIVWVMLFHSFVVGGLGPD